MTKRRKHRFNRIKRTVSRSRKTRAAVEVFESSKDDYMVCAVFYGKSGKEALWRADDYCRLTNRAHVTVRRMWRTGWRRFWERVHTCAVQRAEWYGDAKPPILAPVLAWLSDFILHPGRQVK